VVEETKISFHQGARGDARGFFCFYSIPIFFFFNSFFLLPFFFFFFFFFFLLWLFLQY
jgi:hypothetical protein